MLSIIGWVVFGLIVGVFAKVLMPGRDPGGTFTTILLGIAGAVVGGFLGQVVLGTGRLASTTGDVNRPGFFTSLILSVVGALILLGLYRLVARRSNSIFS